MKDLAAPVEEGDFMRGHHALIGYYDAGGMPCRQHALAVLHDVFADRRIVASRILIRMTAMHALWDHPLMAAWLTRGVEPGVDLIDGTILLVAASHPLSDTLSFDPDGFFSELLRRAPTWVRRDTPFRSRRGRRDIRFAC